MKDVLLIADLHGNYGKIDSFLELNPDAVIIAGDLTNMGPAEEIEPLLERIDVPCFVVPGNCDPREILATLERSDCVSIHGSRINLGRIAIAGIGGSNPTPFNTPFEMTDKQIDDLLRPIVNGMDKATHNVLVCHAPPKGTLDLANGDHVGSASIRKYMESFDLVCCAHLHECRGVMEVGKTKIVNPGVAAQGECAMLSFGDENGDIRIELKTV
jgi:Icc-related predicted phosphoesterase